MGYYSLTFSFSVTSKSPSIRLIKDVYEDLLARSKENRNSILDIKARIDDELSALRNITYHTYAEKGNYINFCLPDF